MSNFDLRKFLAEGKLHEEAASTEEVMDKPSTKMKMSELKKKIRQEILAELTLAEDVDIDTDGGEETEGKNDENVDFYEGLEEATKDGDGEVPSKDADTDIDIEDKEEIKVDVEEKPKMSTTDSEFLDELEALKKQADAMGDNKLERQIDNTITYFTRQHIAKDTNESIELEEADKDYYDAAERDDAAHIAALEKDMEDDKRSALNEANEDEVPLTSKVKSFINKAISDAKKDGEFENLKKADWFENELIDMLIELFEDKDYDRASKEVKDYIKTKTTIKESLEILRMKKLAGLITEGEYAKALLRENQVNNKYVVKDEELSDKDGDFYYIDKQKAYDYLSQFDGGDVDAEAFIYDDEGWGEFEQYLDNVEQMSDEELEDAMRQDMSYYFFSQPDEI